MAYSNTIGQTVIQVQSLIDHGARRCGKLAEELTSEQQIASRESLYFLLSNLATPCTAVWRVLHLIAQALISQALVVW